MIEFEFIGHPCLQLYGRMLSVIIRILTIVLLSSQFVVLWKNWNMNLHGKKYCNTKKTGNVKFVGSASCSNWYFSFRKRQLGEIAFRFGFIPMYKNYLNPRTEWKLIPMFIKCSSFLMKLPSWVASSVNKIVVLSTNLTQKWGRGSTSTTIWLPRIASIIRVIGSCIGGKI